MRKLSGFLLMLLLVNLAWAQVATTDSPYQEPTFETKVTENTNEVGTTEGELPFDDTTQTETPKPTESELPFDDTTQTETPKPIINQICSAPGVYAVDSNCTVYHECSATDSADGSLYLVTKSCPEREAFDSELQRCGRDISSCLPPVNCSSKGTVPDPESSYSYYLCQPRFNGSGFHIFHINCRKNEVFNPLFGKCLFSLTETISNGLFIRGENTDLAVVKREIQQLKKDYKEEIKKEKALLKAEKKKQDKLEKEAKQLAKEQNKLLTQVRQLEATTFQCETEGNFPSQVAEIFYVACIQNKNEVSAVALECSSGSTFDAQTGTCQKHNSESKEQN